MQSTSWVDLFRLLPPALHNEMALLTTIGLEIAVQNVFRLEDDYMVIRGRMSGTMDNGRIFLIPYDQISHVGFQKPLKEKDVEAIFNGTYGASRIEEAKAAADAEEAEAAAQAPPEPPSAVEAPASPPAAAAAPEPKKAASRVVLLERVRARLAAAAKAKPS